MSEILACGGGLFPASEKEYLVLVGQGRTRLVFRLKKWLFVMRLTLPSPGGALYLSSEIASSEEAVP